MTTEKSELFSKRPVSLRLINSIGNTLTKIGLLSRHVSPEKLLKSAQKQTQLTKFGDEYFILEHLQVLLRYFENDENLNYIGWRTLLGTVQKALKVRLLLECDVHKHPDILQIPIKKPIIIVGFPRSGTTLLQNLLLHHPGCRWLRPWELEVPFPPKNIWGSSIDPRLLRFESAVKKAMNKKYLRELDTLHAFDSPAECGELLLSQTFVSHQIFFNYGFDKYQQWLESISKETWLEVYRYYKKQIQYLSWYKLGSHWVLKSPEHMNHFETLLEVFPDVRIIQIHRDPKRFIPSLCYLTYQFEYLLRKNLEPEKIGQQVLAIFSQWGQKNLALRKILKPIHFYDIHYQNLVEKPIKVVKDIYDYFEMEFPAGMESHLNRWLTEHHGEKRPRHHYNLEQFGLTDKKIDKEFKDYCKYFQVPE